MLFRVSLLSANTSLLKTGISGALFCHYVVHFFRRTFSTSTKINFLVPLSAERPLC